MPLLTLNSEQIRPRSIGNEHINPDSPISEENLAINWPARVSRRFADLGLTGVLTGLDAHASGVDMVVSIDPGVAYNEAGERFELESVGSVTIPAADPDLPRIDLIVVSGTVPPMLTVVSGTPADTPVAPEVPADALVLYEVEVGPGASAIIPSNITDRRTYLRPFHRHMKEVQVASEGQTEFVLTTGAFLPGSGTLDVFVNGALQTEGDVYLEKPDGSGVDFVNGLAEGDKVIFRWIVFD